MSGFIVVTGRLGGDAEIKELKNGTRLMEFSVASDGWDGKAKFTEWYKGTLWNEKLFDAIEPFMKKGKEVSFSGLHKTRLYEGKKGWAVANEVKVDQIRLLGGADDNPDNSDNRQRSKRKPPPVDNSPPVKYDDLDDEIPF